MKEVRGKETVHCTTQYSELLSRVQEAARRGGPDRFGSRKKFTPLCDTHRGDWLHGVRAEARFFNSEELSLIKSSPLPAQLPGPGNPASDWLGVWCIPRWDAYCGDFEILCVVDSSEIWNNWLRGMMHTVEIDLAVWCTLRRLNPCWDARTRLSFLNTWISRRNQKRMPKYFSLFVRSPDGFE